jgi:hypothetical protein
MCSRRTIIDAMRCDAATLAPGAVVVEFSGNALTPCMADPEGHRRTGNAYWEHYRADTQTAISVFAPAHSRVYLAGAPISRVQEATGDFHGGLVNAMYEELASAYGDVVTYVDAGASVLEHATGPRRCRASRTSRARAGPISAGEASTWCALRTAATSVPPPRRPSAVSSPPARSGRAAPSA